MQQIENLGLCLLVIEDSDDTLEMLRKWLAVFGCQMEGVRSASEAMKAMAARKPDLVISDIGMPGVDGYAFIKEMRKSPDFQSVPAIALTGYSREEDRKLALASGYNAHIAKPAEMRQLVDLIKKLTGRGEKV
jgi:two-component system CheB/CheR fusion protein